MTTKLIIGGLAGITVGVLFYRGFIKKNPINGMTWYQNNIKNGGSIPRPNLSVNSDVKPVGPVASPGADGSKSIVGRFDPKNPTARSRSINVGCKGGGDCPTGYQCSGGKCVPFN